MKSETDKSWKVQWHERAATDLQILDITVAKQIVEKVTVYLAQSPHTLGKPLSGNYKHLYRFRHSDYRIVYYLDQANWSLNVLAVGHRKNVYNLDIEKRR